MAKRLYLGNLELLILNAVLHSGEDAYGNSIQEEIANRVGREISLGAIYTTLERMERKGYVCSRISTVPASDRGGRPKRLFKVEALGSRAIRETEAAIRAMSHDREPGWAGA